VHWKEKACAGEELQVSDDLHHSMQKVGPFSMYYRTIQWRVHAPPVDYCVVVDNAYGAVHLQIFRRWPHAQVRVRNIIELISVCPLDLFIRGVWGDDIVMNPVLCYVLDGVTIDRSLHIHL